ncbi:MAG: flagellar export chaperone FliS [Pseudomonadota bacterium]
MNAILDSALKQYRTVGIQSGIADASSHRLIEMLMEGALEKIAFAKGNIERGEIAEKGLNTSFAISIIDGLRTSLDMDGGGEIAQNLEALYEYMVRSLVEANSHNDVAKLDEVANVLGSVKSAWDAIPDEYRNVGSRHSGANS